MTHGGPRAVSILRSVTGAAAVAVALVALVPDEPEPEPWRPPDGFRAVDTVSLDGDRALRLWAAPSGWYVESLAGGASDAAVGASGRRDQLSVSEVLGGLVGTVPAGEARSVTVRSGDGVPVRADVHSGLFLLPADRAAEAVPDLLVTPFDAAGRPLAAETSVPVTGRS